MTKLIIIGALVAVTSATAACNRPNEEAADARGSAPEVDTKDRDTAHLQRRLDDLERKWRDVTNRVSSEADAATSSARAAIEEDLKAARQAIAELRTTTVDNWWERQERQLEQAAQHVERDVRTLARNWTPSGDGQEVGTSGDGSDWARRRDVLVARMEKRVHEMENALANLDPRNPDGPAVDTTRERIEQMKEDTDRLRRSSEHDWWTVTKERLDAQLDRLDAAIDRLAQGRS